MKNTGAVQRNTSQKKFHMLIDAICRTAGVAIPESFYGNIVFQIDGVIFSLLHMDALDPDHLVILADFGAPPPEERNLILERLLEINFYAYHGKEGPSFCISPANGHVILMNRLPLTDTTAQGALLYMTSLVELAKLWQTHHFLEEPTVPERRTCWLH